MPKEKNFQRIVDNILNQSDLVILVGDARFPELSINQEVIDLINYKHKSFCIVLNKSDLVDFDFIESQKKKLQKKYKNVIFVSNLKRHGSEILRSKIRELVYPLNKEKYFVGFVGYPNTGKSSVINLLVGKNPAKTSIKPGYTRGMQLIKMTKKIYLYDTPGVIDIYDPFLRLVLGFAKIEKEDTEYYAEVLINYLKKNSPNSLIELYGANSLEEIAIKKNRLIKGGKPDLQTISRIIMQDWQKGKLTLFDKTMTKENFDGAL